jgi:hypothetical protein
MDPRTRNVFVAALLVLVVASAGALILLGGTGANPGGSANAPSVVGVIVGVQSEGLDRVRGFDLRTQDGATLAFKLGNLENGATFPPGHLVEHQATAQPVRVWYRTDGESMVAIRVEDAA